MRLGELLDGLGAVTVEGDRRRRRASAWPPTRAASRPGDVFVALAGRATDGRRHVAEAARARRRRGRRRRRRSNAPGAVGVRCAEPRRLLAHVAARLAGDPSAALTLVGVTGTNGKTTTTYLLEGIWRAAGARTGVIGTIAYRFAGESRPAPFTTPEAPELQALLADMRQAGVTHVAMEVSSHALAQHRADGLRFDAAAFTNLTRDHLDFHGDVEAYFAAKARLFHELLPASGQAGRGRGRQRRRCRRRAPGGRGRRDAACASGAAPTPTCASPSVESTLDGTEGVLVPRRPSTCRSRVRWSARRTPRTSRSPRPPRGRSGTAPDAIVGRHRVGHAAAGPGRADRRARASRSWSTTRTRPTRSSACWPPCGRSPPGALITVFGCGGDRDRGKRPLMGEAAARASDLVVITSDNPRTEDPQRILAEIEPGVRGAGPAPLARADRRARAATWSSRTGRPPSRWRCAWPARAISSSSPARGTRTTRSSAPRSATSTTAKRCGARWSSWR